MVINEQYMTPEQTAQYLGLTSPYIRALYHAGTLQGVMQSKRLYLYRASVEAYEQARRNKQVKHVSEQQATIEIGKRCRQARNEKGLTYRQAADRVGCSASMVYLQEVGRRKIQKADISLYAAAYGVSAKWLESGHDS